MIAIPVIDFHGGPRLIRLIANTVIALRRCHCGRTEGKTHVFPPELIRWWRWDFILWWSDCPSSVGPTVEIVMSLTVTCVASVTGYDTNLSLFFNPPAPSVLSVLLHWIALFQICMPDDILYRIMGYVRRINYTIPKSPRWSDSRIRIPPGPCLQIYLSTMTKSMTMLIS